MRFYTVSAVPFAIALALVGAATVARAAQDTPMTANGVTVVCTGVGSAKDNPDWKNYPVKLVLANNAGENLAAAHVSLSQNGKVLVETDCDAPWILFRGPAGSYTATATLVGGSSASRSTPVTMGSRGQKEITLTFAARQQASAQ
jgi:hypothetical protein